MKKPAVHYWHYKANYTRRGIACGVDWMYAMFDTRQKRNVTCRNCKRTKIYKGK